MHILIKIWVRLNMIIAVLVTYDIDAISIYGAIMNK